MFRIDARCDMSSLNVRKEKHGDERVLAVDITLIAIVPAETVAGLVGAPPAAFRKLWWDSKGVPALENIKPIQLTTKLAGTGDGTDSKHRIVLEDHITVEDRCTIIDKFVAAPIEGHKCSLTFRVAISEPSQDLIDVAAACLQESVMVTITPDDELPLDHSEAGKSDDGGEDDEPLPLAAEQSEEDDAQASAESGTVAVDGSAPDDQIPEKIRKAWEEEDRQRAAAAANG